MKQILIILLTSSSMLAQDTTNVFIDLNIETKVIKVRPQETVCLHFVDGKNRQREVTTLFSDGSHTHTMWETKQKTICSPSNITEVLIGKPKEIK